VNPSTLFYYHPLPDRPFFIMRKGHIFAFFSLFVFIAIIYANSLNGAWLFDDQPHIVENKHVHLKTLQWENIQETFYGKSQQKISRPVTHLTFGLNYYVGRLDPLGYHWVNLAILYLSAVFLFLFIYRTLNLPHLKTDYGSNAYAIALLSTFFWAASPLHVMAVTYITQRMASMVGLFYIMGMYFYLMGRTDEKTWKKITFYGFSILSAILAVGTKENAIMLPASIYLYDLFLIQGISKDHLKKNFKYIIAPAVIVLFLATAMFLDVSDYALDYLKRPFTMWERLLTESRVMFFYISLLLYPTFSRLSFTHDFEISRSLLDPWTTAIAILMILFLMLLAFYLSKRKPLIAYCILFFFLNHLIEGSFISLELVYEYRNYIPSMLFFVLPALFVIRSLDYFSHRRSFQLMIVGLASLVLFANGHSVYMYNAIFKDPYLLWSDNIAKAPKLSRPYNNLGNVLSSWGLQDIAYDAYKKSYELNRNELLPMGAAPINNMGLYHFRRKDYATALPYLQKAIQVNPGYWPAWISLAQTQVRLNDIKSAERTIHQALRYWPYNAQLRATRSFILLKQGRFDDNIREAWKALVIENELSYVLKALAEGYRRTGRYEKALFYWEKYLADNPNDIEANFALIELYHKTGQKEKLDRMIGKAMYFKGAKTWRATLDDYTKYQLQYAYEMDPKMLLSIIRNHLKNQP